MDTQHNKWAQGYFVDHPQYRNRDQAWKDKMNEIESFLVRPYPTRNAICKATTPEDAKWIASRLNLAADFEQLTHDFEMGKIAGWELIEYVRKALSKI